MRPAHLASAGGHESVVRLLRDLGADLFARSDPQDASTPTPLEFAEDEGHTAVAQLLREFAVGN